MSVWSQVELVHASNMAELAQYRCLSCGVVVNGVDVERHVRDLCVVNDPELAWRT